MIIGRKNEPHPLFVFQKFIAMADAGQLDEAVMPFAEETRAKLTEWQEEVFVRRRCNHGTEVQRLSL